MIIFLPLCPQDTEDEIITAVKKMKHKYEELLHGNEPETSNLSPGQMLLMGFDGLFTRLVADITSNCTMASFWQHLFYVKKQMVSRLVLMKRLSQILGLGMGHLSLRPFVNTGPDVYYEGNYFKHYYIVCNIIYFRNFYSVLKSLF